MTQKNNTFNIDNRVADNANIDDHFDLTQKDHCEQLFKVDKDTYNGK